MYKTILQKFGLKPTEIEVYTTLLELGEQPASLVAKKLNLKRTTVRVYLENLTKLGLIKFHWKDRAQYFSAETPEQALANLRIQQKKSINKMEKKLQDFATIIPELTSMIREDAYMPKVIFFEGTDQLKRMYKDTLTSESEILCLSSIEDMVELFGVQYDTWYVKKRVKKQIPLRYIAKDSKVERKERKKDKQFMRQSRFIPHSSFDISNEINIYDNKVSIITLRDEKIGILIESQEIYRTMKVIFETLWMVGQ